MARGDDQSVRPWMRGGCLYGADDLCAAWLQKHIGEPFKFTPGEVRAVGMVKGRRIKAAVVYEDATEHNVNCAICSIDPHIFTRERLREIFQYPFIQLGAARISTVCASSNRSSQSFQFKAGLRVEARLEKAAHDGSDLIIHRMFRHECPWI